MRIFVAGASGVIGRQLVPLLATAGHEVFGTTRLEAKRPLLGKLGATPLVIDALNPTQVVEAVRVTRPDVIVHELTAIGAIDTRHMERSFAATNQLRTAGTDNLMLAARETGVGRVVAQSHVALYRRSGGPVKSEADPIGNQGPAGMRANERAIEYLETAVLGEPALEGIVLRYGWFYGPGTSMSPEGETFDLIRRRRFPLVGDGEGVWSFVHVFDAARATLAAVESRATGIYNIVDNEPARVNEWLPELASQLGAKRPIHLPQFIARLFAGEAGVVMMTDLRGASNAKAKRELGWQLQHPTWRAALVGTLEYSTPT